MTIICSAPDQCDGDSHHIKLICIHIKGPIYLQVHFGLKSTFGTTWCAVFHQTLDVLMGS